MSRWKHTLRIKHLLTEEETTEAVAKSMQSVCLACCARSFMNDFEYRDEMAEVTEVNDANEILDSLYDYCDARGIWVE